MSVQCLLLTLSISAVQWASRWWLLFCYQCEKEYKSFPSWLQKNYPFGPSTVYLLSLFTDVTLFGIMLPILVSLAALAIGVTAQAPPDDSALVAQLITSNTQVNRINDIKVSDSLRCHIPVSYICDRTTRRLSLISLMVPAGLQKEVCPLVFSSFLNWWLKSI